MSLLQAMSIGLPAIVTDVGGMQEIVRLSGGGVCVPVGDAAAMAEAMVRMAQDHNLRTRCGERAKHAFEEHFTLRQMHEAYMHLYSSGRGKL